MLYITSHFWLRINKWGGGLQIMNFQQTIQLLVKKGVSIPVLKLFSSTKSF